MSSLDNTWFTEEWPGEQSAISLQITEKLHEEQSTYQKIEVFQTASFGKLLTLDGLVMVTERDNFIYHEMLSHPALLSHANPQKVLIIGGGDCGTLREVLKHDSVQHVDMVEIDERVTRVAEQFFPELCSSNHDPRAHIQFDDGINWVRECKPDEYDVILIDGSDPEGPAAVLFSEEFLQACYRSLKTGGVFAGQSESPLFHMELIKHLQRTLKKAGFSDVATLNFPQCTYPSGWWSATLAGKQASLSSFREQPEIQGEYYNHQVHQAALAMPSFMARQLSE